MADPRFFVRAGPFTLGALAAAVGATPASGSDASFRIEDVGPIESAGPTALTYALDRKFVERLAGSQAGACVLRADHASAAPAHVKLLLTPDPARAFGRAAQLFYPSPKGSLGIDPRAFVDGEAMLGEAVSVGPGAVIGPRAEIGAGTRIGANSVIGEGCAIGRGCVIADQVSISHALIGDRVVVHAGARLGSDGFSFAMGPEGHQKIPQLGRVIIQDDVEIGANTTIDRGAGPDTVIGAGTKIDNLVQIGHNVRVGRGCVIAAHCGIAGSTELGDFVAMGGKVGVNDHITIGTGARIAAYAAVMKPVPAGEVHCGIPAKPIREFMREIATLSRLAKEKRQRDE